MCDLIPLQLQQNCMTHARQTSDLLQGLIPSTVVLSRDLRFALYVILCVVTLSVSHSLILQHLTLHMCYISKLDALKFN